MAGLLRRSLLIVSSSEKGITGICELLGNEYDRTVAASGGEARRKLMSEGCRYDVAVINTPLTDEIGDELALLLQSGGTAVLLLVKGERFEDYSLRMTPQGVAVLPRPVIRSLFGQTLRMAEAFQLKLNALRRENEQIRQKLDELRIISRAKCLLIEHEGMTEPEAHRYIEKNAMDLRISRKEIADCILARYI